ncbi:IucA/IucC family protein [Thermoactinomyces mirandus]|uniref:IucA/IucC family siderophore biosynthesis protein n=1 Tax=Thermoactinomyces mirandus TaxID=2756294 RepID=A0A7W1XTA0_9BACL|nr:IucA/IucC family protein [Thermoactinomyces mirandus]MBA4602820.1 IucA/IucC family siderophore biosynthesis protein [Thermoactinomyces mirandus]
MQAKKIAERASMLAFFNCYLRETNHYKRSTKDQLLDDPLLDGGKIADVPAAEFVRIDLEYHQIEIIAPVKYWSLTDRHLFYFPFYYRAGEARHLKELDYVTLVTVIIKELALKRDLSSFPDELVYRVIQSCQQIESYVMTRGRDAGELYQTRFEYLDSEQSLVFGHLLHPTPKSRQGLSDLGQKIYSPELKGRFSLHYFRAHHSIVSERSHLPESATRLIKNELMADPEVDEPFKKMYLKKDEYSLIPLHPVQAKHLLMDKRVRQLMQKGLLEDLGLVGKAYYPTSSFRTVYHPESSFMLKFSVKVKITNSVRMNKYKELERGVEVTRILDSEIGNNLKLCYPGFYIIQDPAFITIQLPGSEESGFEVVLRENPFKGGDKENVTVVAGLCQDAIPGYRPRLANIIHELSAKEGRDPEEVSLDWFKRYLSISLHPMMWLYLKHGIALEAHQQNSLVQLKNGYPCRFFYRDNQGYYYCESTFPFLERLLPGVNKKSHSLCADHVADERFRYYFFINHLFGLINAFGVCGLIREEVLLEELRQHLVQWKPRSRASSRLIESLLHDKWLSGKANLLTRFYDMDELTGPMESQSVYVKIANPLLKGGIVVDGVPGHC